MEIVNPIPGLGLASWLAAGALGGVVARFLPPREPRPGWGASLGWGIGGGLLGGLAATALGFGGALAFDGPATVVGLLAGVLALLLRRLLGSRTGD